MHAGVFRHERARDADAHAFDPPGQRAEVVGGRAPLRTGRVFRIGAGDDLQAQRGVGHRGGERPDLIE